MTEQRQKITLPEPHRKFAEVLGVEAALRLSENYGGEEIYIPKIDAVHNMERNAAICRLHAQGLTVKQLCERFGLKKTAINNILKQNRKK